MAVTATTVVVDKNLTEAKAEKEGLSFNANAFKVLADFYSSGSIWDNWSAGTLYLRDASSVLTQSDFNKLDGKALSITGNVTDAATIPAKNSLTFNGVSYTHDDNKNPFSVTHFLNITVKDSVFANTVISKNYTTKTSIRNGVPYALDFSNNGSANISNSTIDVLDGYKNVTMLNSSAAKVTSAPEGRLTLLESGELSGTGTLGFGGSFTAKFDREQEASYTIGGITGFKNVTLTGLDPRKFPENTTKITVGSIVGGKFDYADDPEDRTYYSDGSFSVSNGINVADVSLFANVTVKDSSVGDIVGGESAMTVKSVTRNDMETLTATWRTGGRVTVNNSSAGNIIYYDSVALTNSSSGLIYRNSLSKEVTAGDTGTVKYYTAAGSVNVKADAKFAGDDRQIVIGKFEGDNAGSVDGFSIYGYANVNISGYRDNRAPENNVSVTIKGNITGGNLTYNTLTNNYEQTTASGSITLANDVTVNGRLFYFANVTVKDGSSAGDIVGGDAVATEKITVKNGIESVTTTYRTGGRVTVANSCVQGIWYYDSVSLTNSSSGLIYRNSLSKEVTAGDTGTVKYYTAAGSVNVRADAKFAGEGAERIISIGDSENDYDAIEGYANVNISGYRDNRAPENNVSVDVDGDIVGGNAEIFSSDARSDTATGSITLANDVTVNGKISFFSNVNIKDSVVGNEIVYGDRKTTSKNSTKKESYSDSSYEGRNLVTTVTYKNDGKLTAVNSKLGQVRDYANVSLTNTYGGDIRRNMLASDIIEEYQWRFKNEDGKWEDWQSSGSDEHHTYSAAGSVTVRADKSGWDRATEDDAHGGRYFNIGDIYGYMNVTVNGFNDRSKNNQDIKVQAGDITGGSYEGVRDGDYHSGSALGSANFNFASAGNIFGYKSVNAVDTNIYGDVIAGSSAGFYGFDPESNDWEPSAYYGSYTSSYKETGNGSNASGVAKSADRFSLTNGWVTGDVRGYNVVTLTGGEVEGTVDLGVAYSNGNSYSYVNGSSSEYHKTTATASATVRNAKVGVDITGYRMVTVDNSSVGGDIEFIDVERGDDAIQISTSHFDDWSGSSKGEITGKEIATGSLTVRDSEVKGNIRGYNSVNFTNGSAGILDAGNWQEGNIDNWIYNYNAKYSIIDGETVKNNATLEYKASGNFTARVDKKGESDLYQFGAISGFEKVAISGFADKTAQKSVIVNGSITGGKLSIEGESEIPYYGFSIDDIPEIIDVSDLVFAASGSVELDKNVQVNDSVYGFDSVTVKDSAVAGEIKATPDEGDFNAVYDGVNYSEFAVSGKLVNLTNGKAGSVTGYKQVNISGIYNEIGNYTGTAGDDTLKIAGNSALRVNSLDFGEGKKDTLLLEGTLIIDDPINLNWDSLESVSGRGAIATATDKLAEAESVCGTDINFIDLGGMAVGFKGAAWELADDSAVKAAFWDGESELTGWLCGDFDSNYKTVVDTVDYIRFTATDDGYLGFGGSADIAVSGWKVGDEDNLFASNTFNVAAGSEYIIKLEKEGADSASYTVTFNLA